MPATAKKLMEQSDHPQVEEISKILAILGMPSKLKSISSDLEIYDLLKSGLPARVIKSFIKKTGFSTHDISTALLITERKIKILLSAQDNAALTPIVSAAIWQVASVFTFTETVFGSKEAARDWLSSKPIGTAYRRPIDLLALPIGIEFILRYLHQIEHGVYI